MNKHGNKITTFYISGIINSKFECEEVNEIV